jgi:hypothetical protein
VATQFTTPAAEVIGRVVSRLDHAVTLTYGQEQIRLSARGKTNATLVKGLLGALPAGTTFVPVTPDPVGLKPAEATLRATPRLQKSAPDARVGGRVRPVAAN